MAKNNLLETLREQKRMQLMGGIYHKVQIDLTFNSNHIEGSRLTHDQTRYIFETNIKDCMNGLASPATSEIPASLPKIPSSTSWIISELPIKK